MRRKTKKHAEMTQSTAVIHCRSDGIELGAAIASLTESGAAALETRLAPVLAAGEEMPDVRLLLRLMGRLVERQVAEVDEADAARWQAGMRLLLLRDRCREMKAELHAATVRVRKILVELFGSSYTRLRFGLGARTARGAADLALEAGRIARRLVSGPELPKPRTPGLTIAPRAWAESLRPAIDSLERLLREVEAARIRLSDLVGERDRRLESSRATYLQVARSVETLFVLAGEAELAKGVRSSARRRERMAEARRCRRRSVVAASVRAPRRAIERLRSTVVSFSGWLARRKRRVGRGSPTADPRNSRWHGGGWRPKTAETAVARGL